MVAELQPNATESASVAPQFRIQKIMMEFWPDNRAALARVKWGSRALWCPSLRSGNSARKLCKRVFDAIQDVLDILNSIADPKPSADDRLWEWARV